MLGNLRPRLSVCARTASLAAALIVAAGSLPVQAQQFSFGFSTGGHHHHHHGWYPGCWPEPCWGPWYRPSVGFIYAPPPVIRERVVYVEPARVSAWAPPVAAPVAAAPAPAAAAATPVANSLPSDERADDRIVIHNGGNAKLPVAFLVDGQDVELDDGGTRTFLGQTRRTVQYDRGGRFGSTQQDVSAGHYEFRITASGWDLVRKPQLAAPSRTAVRTNALPDSTQR